MHRCWDGRHHLRVLHHGWHRGGAHSMLHAQHWFSGLGLGLGLGTPFLSPRPNSRCRPWYVFSARGNVAFYVWQTRQKAKWKKEVVKSILSQDVTWFDTSSPEGLTTKMAESVELIFKAPYLDPTLASNTDSPDPDPDQPHASSAPHASVHTADISLSPPTSQYFLSHSFPSPPLIPTSPSPAPPTLNPPTPTPRDSRDQAT